MILLITGPAGAGKSMTSQKFLDSANGTWAYLNQDELRQLVKTGYATADDYEYNWSEDVRNQWRVSIPICCDIAKRYEEASINCLIDFNASPDEFNEWKKYLDSLDYELVVLLPTQEVVLTRNSNRDERSKLKNNKVLQNYDKLAEWNSHDANIIDNSEGTVGKTVDRINELLK